MRLMLFAAAFACAVAVTAPVGAAVEPDLVGQVAASPQLKVEEVCIPMRTTRGGRVDFVPNPDGKTYDLLIYYYKNDYGPYTTVYVDLGTNRVKFAAARTRADEHCWGRGGGTLGPDGKFYQPRGAKGGSTLQVYDPAENKVYTLKEVAKYIGGERRPLVIGTDGKMYGGGSNKGRAAVYQFDSATGKITSFGKVGPSHAPNTCWGYSVSADDRYVYIASGKIPWYLVCYDRQTKKDEVLLKTDDPRGHIHTGQLRYGCTASVRGHGKTDRYWLYKGKAIPQKDRKEKPPWPVPEKKKPWVVLPPRPEVWTGKLVPKADGKVEIWYRSAEAKAKAPKAPPAGEKPEDLGWKIIKIDVPTYPVQITRVETLPDGRIFGASGPYLGNFVYDPKTRKSEHLGIVHLSHYCQTVLDGKIYMSGYPSSALFVYDPAKPWTVGISNVPGVRPLRENHKDSNPRRLCYLAHHGAGTHKMWAAANGADGKCYFGGRWARNGEGGGLGWWDPKTQQAGGISDPFSNYQIIWVTAAAGGRHIVVSTRTVRDQATNTPAPREAKLFVFDTQQGKIVREFVPVKDCDWSGPIAAKGNIVVGLTLDPADRARILKPEEQDEYLKDRTISYGVFDKSSILYAFDVTTGKMLYKKKLPYPVGFRANENFGHQDGFDMALGPDGWIWTFSGSRFQPVNPEKRWHYSYVNCALVRIKPEDGSIKVVGKLSHGGEMAFADKDLYLAGGCKYLAGKNEALRCIRNVVP